MPLKPYEKASLALAIVSARFLDDYVLPNQLRREAGLGWLRATVDCWIARAEKTVLQNEHIADFLRNAARALINDCELDKSVFKAEIQQVALQWSRTLIDIADRIKPDDGDGPATDKTSPPCSCGFLELAAEIENRVENEYHEASALRNGRPTINYSTYVQTDVPERGSEESLFDGKVMIDTFPRLVQILVFSDAFGARDLCHLVYILHHELICHAYQTLRNSELELKNPPVEDHWSEGWMDKCAFELAKTWVEDTEHGWLLIGDTDATEAMGYFHKLRYEDKAFKKKRVAAERRGAREAFVKLGHAFIAGNYATDSAGAKNLVKSFSLLANSHPEATYTLLKQIGTRLQDHLLTRYRRDAAKVAAEACMDFINHYKIGDLANSLENALDKP